jgi:hypothetical protein
MKQKILRIFFLIILVLSFSCEKKGLIVQCSDCTVEEPVTAVLEALLDPELYGNAIIQIWDGNLEDSILIGNYGSGNSTFSRELTLNKKYTITATYHISNVTYVAVDSATPRVRYAESQCDEACYFIYDRKCDLRLKYIE